MTRLETLKDAAQGFHTRIAQFLLLSRDTTHLLCVFEGADHYYYGPRIDLHLPHGRLRRNFPMGGRYNVMRLIQLRETNPDIKKVVAVYFVDKDYGVPESIDPIEKTLYVTSSYSIENFYSFPEVLQSILHDIFHIGKDVIDENGDRAANPERARIVASYKKLIDSLNAEVLLPLNAFVRAVVDSGLAQKAKLQLWKFTLTELTTISLKGHRLVDGPITFERLKTRFATGTLISNADYEHHLSELAVHDLLVFGRGKFYVEVLETVLKELWDDSRKPKPVFFAKKREPALSYNKTTLLTDISGFATTPANLKSFLSTSLA